MTFSERVEYKFAARGFLASHCTIKANERLRPFSVLELEGWKKHLISPLKVTFFNYHMLRILYFMTLTDALLLKQHRAQIFKMVGVKFLCIFLLILLLERNFE